MFIFKKSFFFNNFSFIFLFGCQLKEPHNNHGILFLKNRSDQLIVNKSNKTI